VFLLYLSINCISSLFPVFLCLYRPLSFHPPLFDRCLLFFLMDPISPTSFLFALPCTHLQLARRRPTRRTAPCAVPAISSCQIQPRPLRRTRALVRTVCLPRPTNAFFLLLLVLKLIFHA
jgi:hypothetical protein